MWSTGDKYEGDWEEFLKHGYGTDYFANGDSYTGQYRYGKPYGRGVYYWVATTATYEGEFIEGKKEGKGRWFKKEPPTDFNEKQVYYEGDYKNDLKHGHGEYQWQSGNRYKGGYKEDKRHGYGEMFWVDGSSYRG